MRTALIRLFRANALYPGMFCAFSVMGWIFHCFGVALVIFSYKTYQASGFFLAGLGMWALALIILAVFFQEPSPRSRHRR